MAAERKDGRARERLEEAGRAVWRSPALVRTAEWLIRFLLGAALAGGRVLGEAAPFGVALVGAGGAGAGGLAALLGAVGGYLVSRGLEDGLRYAAACILTFSVAFAFYDVKLYRRSWFMPLCAALLSGCAGLIALTARRWTAAVGAAFFGELALTAAGTYFFRLAFSAWEGPGEEGETTFRQRVGVLLLGAAVLVSLAEVTVVGTVSVGRVAAVYAVLAAGWAGGLGTGAAVGVAAGLAMDLTAGAAPFYTMAYGFMGLLCGLGRRQRRVLTALAGAASAGLILLWGWGRGGPLMALWEGLLGAGLFLVTPRGLLGRVSALFAGEEVPSRESWAAGEAKERLAATAGAFADLFSALKGAFGRPAGEEDPSVIFDRAANRVCVRCPLRERCWQTGYTDTYTCLNDALPQLLEAGRGESGMFPQRFRDRCTRFPAFLEAVNGELEGYRARKRYRSRVGESRRAVCRQYGDMAQVLEETAEAMAAARVTDGARTRRLRQFLAARGLNCRGLVFYGEEGRLRLQVEGRRAEELADEAGRRDLEAVLDLPLAPAETALSPAGGRVVYREASPLMAMAGVAGRKKPGQTVSGDAGGWFKDEEGRLYLILCDGMGSGPEARRESDLTLGLLEKFLRAGVHPELALKTLNEALVLRGEETGGFSTVDLLALDLYTGKAALYKLGAAPSYLRRGGCVTRLAGDALPAGLALGEGREPDKIPFQMDPGDSLILLTDGVLGEGDEWLRGLLSEFEEEAPKALAERLVDHDPAPEDDRTAMVLRVGLRERG